MQMYLKMYHNKVVKDPQQADSIAGHISRGDVLII